MTIQLPRSIDRYFSAQNAHDVDAMAACFAHDATAFDEGKNYVGRNAIRDWKAATVVKLNVATAPFQVREDGGRTTVTATVSGNFPASPVNLTFVFGLSGDTLIKTLEIHP